MRRLLLPMMLLSACATVPVTPGEPLSGDRVEVEVVGQVTRACPVAEPGSNLAVTLRQAGELDALDTTRTDASGAFHFKVRTQNSLTAPLLIEAQGVRALATQRSSATRNLVAEVRLPCAGNRL
jgi:hypothetical protein